jgi:uncharacterized protein (TIGR03435 family)
MSNNSVPKCPQCGATLPPHAPAGLCPSCLMALNLKAETVFTDDQPPAQPPLPAERIAPHFPQLEILECLGRGGMGVVYKARQKTLDRFVALKLLAPERVHDASFAERFTREARALAALNHPNIVTIHDFGQAGGFYYLLMEFVDGANLRQLLRARKFTPEEALAIVPPLCDALQFAHERGIVHCDIKPENLLLDQAGRVKVADFGVAKMLGPANGASPGSPAAAAESAGPSAVGTPGYSAPEQLADPRRVDGRADIYSLGAVFYEMLTGELPGKRIESPSRKVQIDVRLDAVVLRALEKMPELRWQTAAEFRTQVETIAGGQNPAGAAASAGKESPGTSTAPDWRAMRRKTVLWGLALTAISLFALPYFYLRIWSLNLFGISATLALVAEDRLGLLRWAKRLVLIEGIVVATAAVRFAFLTPELSFAWRNAIVGLSLAGIAYGVAGWRQSRGRSLSSGSPAPWTRVKTVIIAGVGLVLGAGTTLAILMHHRLGLLEEPSWALDTRTLNSLPPLVALRPSDGHRSGIASTDDRMVGRGVSLGALIAFAYGPPSLRFHWSANRVLFPPGVPDGKSDFLLTVPDRRQEALRAQIKKQLGLVAHRELREADVFVLLLANPSGAGLAISSGNAGSSSSDQHLGRNGYKFTNMPIDNVSDFLEDSLGKPVVNETELTQKYSGSLTWPPQSDPAARLQAIQAALSAQLGLELVPSRQPVEMLVVDKVPN